MIKQIVTIIVAALVLAACGDKEQQLKERAAELCQYIPDHELREESKAFMTTDFYAVLDTMFNHLPEHEAMDHEWLYYFRKFVRLPARSNCNGTSASRA